MGGKSRKSGGVSKRLIDQLVKDRRKRKQQEEEGEERTVERLFDITGDAQQERDSDVSGGSQKDEYQA